MSDKELEGKWDQAKGKAKEEFGKLTDDKSTEAEGKTDQVKGEIKEGLGEAKRKIKNTFDDK
ncbi:MULTISPECIES: CsbD family protein [Nonlabens]|uniref:CsbD-like protein n=1 Tax=Nonlabens ulvanivorans TaxID=906888 RepID=A0A084JWI8_NONUL|nr:CsbD family protein [Nonlabens ulvanivorans]KEZ93322.1 hypothetical protein IL45_14495 [Nonlabens ulvanivorans]PRX13553.1 CsbD-like protein [Nonlabens ulvanivorans]WOI23813.1 CsbD family protein [Nonlabens ulvanivorans]GAK94131.1 protein YjbJ [Nonlabens ulvanivorans]GAK99998.1 protein yjbJ [Nonlabens ulvanivorans]